MKWSKNDHPLGTRWNLRAKMRAQFGMVEPGMYRVVDVRDKGKKVRVENVDAKGKQYTVNLKDLKKHATREG